MGSLKIFDTVKFSLLDSNLIKVKDDYAGTLPGLPQPAVNQPNANTQQGLLVRIAATHSGLITRNNGFYLPDRMRKGSTSFTDNYQKPVLLHHDDHSDNIGRIIQSAYRDTSGSILDNYDGLEVKDRHGKIKGTINDELIKDFCSGKMPLGMQVDVVTNILKDSLLEDKSYEGLGFIEIVANITDPVAIQKLLDGRYLTGSVGATTDAAICSVCRSDWTDSGQCEHKPGGIYDKAKCFIIAGSLVYDEYSFVNVPADRHSKVLELNYNGIQDSIEMEKQYTGRHHEVQLGFPQYETQNKEENSMKIEDAKTKDSVDEATTETQETEATEVVTDEVKPSGEGTETETKEVKDEVETSTETTETDETSETETETEVKDEASTDEKVEDEAKVEDKKVEDEAKFEDLVTRAITDEALEDEEVESLYDALYAEIVAAVNDGELIMDAEELANTKLSTEARKKLAKSKFCGSNKSLPIPDCAHIVAARRLMEKYKGEADKDKILASISRKAKALDCTPAKDSVKTTDEVENTETTTEVQEKLSDKLKELIGSTSKDELREALTEAEIVLDRSDEENALLDEIVQLEETVGDLRDRLEAVRKEYSSLSQDFDGLQDSVIETKLETRKVKEAHLKTLKVLKDQKVDAQEDLSALEDTTLDSEITQTLETVDMSKIADKLGNGMSRVPEGGVHAPDGPYEDAKEPKQEVLDATDQAKVQEYYLYLRMSKGQDAAEAYLKDVKQKRKLPQG